MMLLYPDVGFLSLLSKDERLSNKLGENQFVVAYSQATFWDLSKSQNCNRELNFLNKQDFVFLSEEQDGIALQKADPNELYAQVDLSIPKMLGGLFSRMVGGGDDVNDPTFLYGLISQIPEITDSEIASVLDRDDYRPSDVGKKDFAKAFNAREKMTPGQTLKQFLDRPGEPQNILRSCLPKDMPTSVCETAMIALVLNFIANQPAKGIQAVGVKSAENEVVDAFHIAYGLHCHTFVTHDKASFSKFRLLVDFWRLPAIPLFCDQSNTLRANLPE